MGPVAKVVPHLKYPISKSATFSMPLWIPVSFCVFKFFFEINCKKSKKASYTLKKNYLVFSNMSISEPRSRKFASKITKKHRKNKKNQENHNFRIYGKKKNKNTVPDAPGTPEQLIEFGHRVCTANFRFSTELTDCLIPVGDEM